MQLAAKFIVGVVVALLFMTGLRLLGYAFPENVIVMQASYFLPLLIPIVALFAPSPYKVASLGLFAMGCTLIVTQIGFLTSGPPEPRGISSQDMTMHNSALGPMDSAGLNDIFTAIQMFGSVAGALLMLAGLLICCADPRTMYVNDPLDVDVET